MNYWSLFQPSVTKRLHRELTQTKHLLLDAQNNLEQSNENVIVFKAVVKKHEDRIERLTKLIKGESDA